MDWNGIRSEYIASDIGYRELAKKYGASFSTLQKRAKKEDWAGLRRQASDTAVTEVVTAVTNANVDRALRIQSVADMLLDKIELTIENVDGRKSARAVKEIADALKNVQDIMGIKSEYDRQEQELRLAKLKRETEAKQSSEITISFADSDIERWSS